MLTLHSKKCLGKSNLTSGNAYKCVAKNENGQITFVFNDNIYNNASDDEIIASLGVDASCYECANDLADFLKEFYTWDTVNAGVKAYNQCKRTYARLKKLLGDGYNSFISWCCEQ